MPTLNTNLLNASCIRCHTEYEITDFHEGCPCCLREKFPSSIQLKYKLTTFTTDDSQHGMQRFPTYLPYRRFITLNEGNTPLIEMRNIASQYHANKVFIKHEGMNPTGSHKDRFSALFIARALDKNHNTVVVASSGNAGLSVATYAKNAGLQAVVVSTSKIPADKKDVILKTGAELVIKDSSFERWEYVKKQVSSSNWYPATNYLTPPVGSHYFGVEAYKTIAYEIIEQMKPIIPTMIIVPCSRGDLLWGIWCGLKEIWGTSNNLPKMIAVEPFPRISRVLRGEDYRNIYPGNAGEMFSIDGSTVTFQSLSAIKESGGDAVVITAEEAKISQSILAKQGIDAELSSATALSALNSLSVNQKISPNDNVVLIVTARIFLGVQN